VFVALVHPKAPLPLEIRESGGFTTRQGHVNERAVVTLSHPSALTFGQPVKSLAGSYPVPCGELD